MSKIDPNANLYDRDGNLIKKAPITNFTIEETEKLVDDLSEKHKENPENEEISTQLDNAVQYLQKLYILYGNPHKDEIVAKMKQYANKDVTEQEIVDALNTVVEALEPSKEEPKTYNVDSNESEYVEYEQQGDTESVDTGDSSPE